MTIGIYLAINALLLLGVTGGLWFLAARADRRGIPPNTTLGFRSQQTLASLHGWYVAQRVGFHFTAVTTSIVTAAVFVIVFVAFVRRANPIWLLIVPAIGGLAIAGFFVIAGQRADRAAVSVETAGFPGPTSDLVDWKASLRHTPSFAEKRTSAASGTCERLTCW